jgi:hypothetical protein
MHGDEDQPCPRQLLPDLGRRVDPVQQGHTDRPQSRFHPCAPVRGRPHNFVMGLEHRANAFQRQRTVVGQ